VNIPVLGVIVLVLGLLAGCANCHFKPDVDGDEGEAVGWLAMECEF
jgi:hypothetical protein